MSEPGACLAVREVQRAGREVNGVAATATGPAAPDGPSDLKRARAAVRVEGAWLASVMEAEPEDPASGHDAAEAVEDSPGER